MIPDWQVYYQQNKGLPMNKIMEGYYRILNEFNERMHNVVTQNSPTNGAGPGGKPSAPSGPSVLVYTPDTQLLNWGNGVEYFSDVTLADFQTNVSVTTPTNIQIDADTTPINTINGLKNYINMNSIDIEYQNISQIDVSGLTNLEYLYFYANTSPTLTITGTANVGQNLGYDSSYINLDTNDSLTTLNLNGFGTNVELYGPYTINLSSVNLGNSQIPYIYLYGCSITSINLLKNKALFYLRLDYNSLQSLNITGNPSLGSLYCGNNQLTTLNISNNKELYYLDASNNQLSQNSVDQILINLDNFGVTSGNVNLGGSGNAVHSSLSNDAITSLLSKGWSLTLN